MCLSSEMTYGNVLILYQCSQGAHGRILLGSENRTLVESKRKPAMKKYGRLVCRPTQFTNSGFTMASIT